MQVRPSTTSLWLSDIHVHRQKDRESREELRIQLGDSQQAKDSMNKSLRMHQTNSSTFTVNLILPSPTDLLVCIYVSKSRENRPRTPHPPRQCSTRSQTD